MKNELETIFNMLAKKADHNFKSLKISTNRYGRTVIEQTIIANQNNQDNKAVTDTINEELASSLKQIIIDGKLELSLKDFLLITSLVLVEEVEIKDYKRIFYPDELIFDMPLPDYKMQLLSKGIPVSATFEKHIVKTTISKAVQTGMIPNK